jgi:hypothetical protein
VTDKKAIDVLRSRRKTPHQVEGHRAAAISSFIPIFYQTGVSAIIPSPGQSAAPCRPQDGNSGNSGNYALPELPLLPHSGSP